MPQGTSIEWTDATWSPVTGCTRVSPGCASCYIERTPPFRMSGRRFARVGNTETTGVQLHPERLSRIPKGPRIFVCSMSDLFHDEVPERFIAAIYAAFMAHPDRVFQVLTKRPERARDLLTRNSFWELVGMEGGQHFPGAIFDFECRSRGVRNVWLGVSIENARYTWRADVLREIPAAVRFISAEPLIGSLYPATALPDRADPRLVTVPGHPEQTEAERVRVQDDRQNRGGNRAALNLDGIDWVICGGESGPHWRRMQPEWALELRDACLRTGTNRIYGDEPDPRPAFFFKQWGGRTPKAGGRLLDGREWDEFPDVNLTPA